MCVVCAYMQACGEVGYQSPCCLIPKAEPGARLAASKPQQCPCLHLPHRCCYMYMPSFLHGCWGSELIALTH